MMIRSNSRPAFSIIELLVVVGIIMILVSIMLPSLQQTRVSARMAMCTSRMHQIYIATTAQKTDLFMRNQKRADGLDISIMQGAGWMEVLTPYVANDSRIFVCPEDSGSYGAYTQYATVTDPDDGDDDDDSDIVPGGGVDPPPPIGPQMIQIQVLWFDNQRLLYNMPMLEGPLTVKRNVQGNPPEAGSSYELWFEDIRPGGGDMDFDDFMVSVEFGSEDVVYSVYKGSAGYHFNIIDQDNNILIEDVGRKSPNGTTVTIAKPRKEEPGDDDDDDDDNDSTTNDITLTGIASYGFNKNFEQKKHAPDSANASLAMKEAVYFLDYFKPVARVDGTSNSDSWDDILDSRGIPVFARHHDKCNVLLTHGAVDLMSWRDIDISEPEKVNTWWLNSKQDVDPTP